MSIEERKEREKQRRRERIIDAAEKVIRKKGLEDATMTEIAQQAELSKGTLYLYFKNKNELYMALVQRGSNMLNSRLAKVFSGDHTGIELIRLMGENYLDFVKNNPLYFNCFNYYDSLRDTEELQNSAMAQTCEENIREAMSLMIRALQVGMQDGTVQDSYDPKELAVLIWASSRGITMINHMARETDHHLKMLEEMEIDTDSLFENFLNMIGGGIATEKGSKIIDRRS